eukprot:13349073-Ditylum_brightwellii.AAC.1
MSSATSSTNQVKCTCFNETTLSSTTSNNKRLLPKSLVINSSRPKLDCSTPHPHPHSRSLVLTTSTFT